MLPSSHTEGEEEEKKRHHGRHHLTPENTNPEMADHTHTIQGTDRILENESNRFRRTKHAYHLPY